MLEIASKLFRRGGARQRAVIRQYDAIDTLLPMRTAIDLNDDLLRRAKKRAAEEGVTLRQVVEAALRKHLSGTPSRVGYRLRWRTERGRMQPGVRLENRDALFDLMEGRP